MIPVLKLINYNMDAGEIIAMIDASGKEWDGTFMQIEQGGKWRYVT